MFTALVFSMLQMKAGHSIGYNLQMKRTLQIN